MIKMQVIGHLGQDATVNQVSGKNVINFSVAHSEKYKNAQNVQMEKTTWVSCSYWTDKTGVAQYLRKGTQVYVEGQPDVKMYENRNREQQANIVCRVFSIQLLGSNQKEGTVTRETNPPITEEPGYKPMNTGDYKDDDDLPF